MPFHSRVKIPAANESLLEIFGLNLTDSGDYECVASNILSSSVKHFTLDVYGK